MFFPFCYLFRLFLSFSLSSLVFLFSLRFSVLPPLSLYLFFGPLLLVSRFSQSASQNLSLLLLSFLLLLPSLLLFLSLLFLFFFFSYLLHYLLLHLTYQLEFQKQVLIQLTTCQNLFSPFFSSPFYILLPLTHLTYRSGFQKQVLIQPTTSQNLDP